MGIDVFQTHKQICACCWLKSLGRQSSRVFVMSLHLLLLLTFQARTTEERSSVLFFPLTWDAMPRFLHPSDCLMAEQKDGLLPLILLTPWLWMD